VDPASARTEDGLPWDWSVTDEGTLELAEPILALIVFQTEEPTVKLGKDFPMVDLKQQEYRAWGILAHQFEIFWGRTSCEGIENWPDKLVLRIQRTKPWR
jgi:hypothetical protein